MALKNLLDIATEGSEVRSLVALTIVTFVCAAFSLCEWIHHIKFEISAIWPKRRCVAKWQYLCGRYLGLLGHMFNIIACTCFYASSGPISWRLCYAWHFFTLLSSFVIIFLLEITSVIQVRVLWDRSATITIFLILLVGSGFVANTIVGVLAFNGIQLSDTCEIRNFPLWAITIPTTKGFTQIVLWILTLIKCASWKADLVSRVIKYSSVTSSLLTVSLTGALVLLIFAVNHSILALKGYPFIYPVFLTLVPALVCHSTKSMYTYSASGQHSASVDCERTVTSSRILSTIISDYWRDNSVDDECEPSAL